MEKLYLRFCILLLANIFISFSSFAQKKKAAEKSTVYYPAAGKWEHRSAAESGMDSVLLQQAVQFAKEHESNESRDLKEAHYLSAFGREPFGFPVGPMKDRGPCSGLVIKNGYIVAEWGEPQRVDLTFSVAKSFLSSMVGLAVDQGLIASVNDKVYPYMAPVIPYEPNRLSTNKADVLQQEDVIDLFGTEHNKKITWDHLLRQTSDWEGSLWGKPVWGTWWVWDARLTSELILLFFYVGYMALASAFDSTERAANRTFLTLLHVGNLQPLFRLAARLLKWCGVSPANLWDAS